MIIVKAKFIGRDGSMGYINGQVYDLKFYTMNSQLIIERTGADARANPPMGTCIYDSLNAFLINWEVV